MFQYLGLIHQLQGAGCVLFDFWVDCDRTPDQFRSVRLRLKARVNTQIMELCVIFTSVLGCIYRKRVCGKIDFKIRIQKESGDKTAPGTFSAQGWAPKISAPRSRR